MVVNLKSNKKKNTQSEDLIHVISASCVLLNKRKREEYDNKLRKSSLEFARYKNRGTKIKSFDYERFLLDRQHIFLYKARFFIYDILRKKGEQSVKIYEDLEKKQKLHLLQNAIGWYDFFDSTFILAEYYQNQIKMNKNNQKEFVDKSLKLYMRVGEMEQKIPYFKEYTEELVDRIFYLLDTQKDEVDFEDRKLILDKIKTWKFSYKFRKKGKSSLDEV